VPPAQIHWFSIVNSILSVLLLTAILITIFMRTLRHDFARFTADEPLPDDDECGWKYIHADVFRFPRHKSLFCALIGAGMQLVSLCVAIFALALAGALLQRRPAGARWGMHALAAWCCLCTIHLQRRPAGSCTRDARGPRPETRSCCAGVFYPYNRGLLYTAQIVLYAMTASVAGYTSARLFRQMGGERWARHLVLTCVIFAGPFFAMFCVLNTVAIFYRCVPHTTPHHPLLHSTLLLPTRSQPSAALVQCPRAARRNMVLCRACTRTSRARPSSAHLCAR
jgi:transmembrane 9 superfamily member 1